MSVFKGPFRVPFEIKGSLKCLFSMLCLGFHLKFKVLPRVSQGRLAFVLKGQSLAAQGSTNRPFQRFRMGHQMSVFNCPCRVPFEIQGFTKAEGWFCP